MTIVQISSGPVRGTIENQLHVFKGIPYAEPVAGEARWLPPQPRRKWHDVFDATRYGDASIQFNTKIPGPYPSVRRRYIEAIRAKVQEGDDSLLLNVWSPTLDHDARLPVMVFIHGGGYTSGAASQLYDASPFASRGVVVVVIQYRLGPLGLLHGSGLFDGELCADNRGFLDQIAALQWVQQNIGAFAGDAGNVTIFGESAGAFSVFQLVASPLARGLFRRAIPMGGNSGKGAPASEYHALTRDVLKDVGVTAGDGRALAALEGEALQQLQKSIVKRVFDRKFPDRYGSLSREKVGFLGAALATDFQPEDPLVRLRAGTANDVDLLLGTCANDGGLFSLMLPLPLQLNAWLFSSTVRGLMPEGDLDAIRRHYREHASDCVRGGISQQINNDTFFRMPTIAAAEAHAARNPGRTWLYQLDYVSAIEGLGAIHGIDVALMFGESHGKALIFRDEETQRLSDLMLDAWTSFAKSGTPGLPDWPAYDLQGRNTLVFDRHSRLIPDHGRSLREYWTTKTAGDGSETDSVLSLGEGMTSACGKPV